MTSFITQACVSVKLPSSIYFLTQIVAQPYPNVRVTLYNAFMRLSKTSRFTSCKGLIPRSFFLGVMRNISHVSFEL